jgi:hypothetical protein
VSISVIQGLRWLEKSFLHRMNCGHQSPFFETTIREAKEMSQRKTVHLGDDDEKHIVVFKKGRMAYIVCPNTVRDDEKD